MFIVGTIIRDRVPTMYVRKSKAAGMHISYFGGFFGAVKQYLAYFSGKNANSKSSLAKGLLKVYGEGIEDGEILGSLKQIAEYADDPALKERLLINPKFATGDFNDKLLKKAINSKRL